MPKMYDLIGQRFGRLVVLEEAERHISSTGAKRRMWLCQCDCGNTTIVTTTALNRGTVRSCGCLMEENRRNCHITHDGSKTLLYGNWCGIKARCYNENDPAYPYYGGRGIKMCDEWYNSFALFREWALANGYKQKQGLSIDRIDVNGNYEPSNCRFVTRDAQANNKRSNVLLTWDGRTQTIAQWARQVGVPYSIIHERIYKLHWDDERAITTPPRKLNITKKITQQRT